MASAQRSAQDLVQPLQSHGNVLLLVGGIVQRLEISKEGGQLGLTRAMPVEKNKRRRKRRVGPSMNESAVKSYRTWWSEPKVSEQGDESKGGSTKHRREESKTRRGESKRAFKKPGVPSTP